MHAQYMMLADVPMSTLSTTTSLQHAQEGKCMCKHCTAHFLRYLALQLTTASALCLCYSVHSVFTLTYTHSLLVHSKLSCPLGPDIWKVMGEAGWEASVSPAWYVSAVQTSM